VAALRAFVVRLFGVQSDGPSLSEECKNHINGEPPIPFFFVSLRVLRVFVVSFRV